MAKIAFGGDGIDPLTGRPRTMLISLINVNSPMTYDATMLGALKVYARANQATIITPFILSGAMSPVTVAGTAAQTLAEALAGMAFAQLVNPGAPVVFGSFASSLSMQSGAPTFGTPEPALVLYVMAALARRLGVPFRSGGSLCASKIPDAQAAFESAQTLLPTCSAGVNFVLHIAGWLEGGLAMGYEKFVMDVDQAGMMHTLLAGVDLSPNGQAMDAIREVGPGNHFLGCDHTQANFESAFYRSPLADNNSFEQWLGRGSLDMAKRANASWKKQLAEYVAPPLDPAIDEALLDYMQPPQGGGARLERLSLPQRCGPTLDSDGLRRSRCASRRAGARPSPPDAVGVGDRKVDDLTQIRVVGGPVRDRHRIDEVRLELRLDGGLDLLDASHERLDRRRSSASRAARSAPPCRQHCLRT